ncbi:MAG: helix-turn-helix transcriptional regulator [Bdellovibrionaceae bacterium]|nr:helix-turn-helix transcriptional regulator [Pseudobdellovibrionaceae bacterium]
MPRKAKVSTDQKTNVAKDLANIATTLRNRRKELNWSQDELSNRMDCDITTVQAWEQQRRTPSLPTLLTLCRVMRLKFFIE